MTTTIANETTALLQATPASTMRDADGLYAFVLGDAARQIADVVRSFHASSETVSGYGRFTITRPRRRISRLVGTLLRFPTDGIDVPVSLVIERHGLHETWRRRFGRRACVSRQRLANDRPVERVGPIELELDIRVDHGTLVIESHHARIALGPVRFPVPRSLTPLIHAEVRASADGLRNRVTVRISSRILGPLLAYEGELTETSHR